MFLVTWEDEYYESCQSQKSTFEEAKHLKDYLLKKQADGQVEGIQIWELRE